MTDDIMIALNIIIGSACDGLLVVKVIDSRSFSKGRESDSRLCHNICCCVSVLVWTGGIILFPRLPLVTQVHKWVSVRAVKESLRMCDW